MLTLEIDEHIKQSLQYIEKRLIDRSVKQALVAIARPVKAKIKSRVPVKSGVLKRAITHSVEINRNRGLAVVYVGLARKNTPGWLITRGLAQEYGNVRTTAQPFLAPAANISRRQVLNDFNDFLDAHLDKLLSDHE